MSLPYTKQVAYIESTGTQYIDTGFKPNQDTRVVCSFEQITTRNIAAPFGCESPRYSAYIISSKFRFDYNSTMTSTQIQVENNVQHEVDFNKNNVYLDGTLNTTFTYGNFTAPNLLLFRTTYSSSYFYGRIYWCKVYDNGVLVRDFIPVRVNETGYLYDKVSGELFGNDGSGNFVLGNDYVYYSGFLPFRRRLLYAKPKELPNFLCFTALESGTFTFTMDTDVPSTSYEYIAYSKDGGNTWIRTDNVTGSQVIATVNVIEGDEVLWKGKATNGHSTSYDRVLSKTCHFGGTAKFNVGGCIVSLIREGDFVGFENSEIVIIRLFQDSKIVEADKNLLPCKAFNSYDRHYENTFTNCTELISPPDLPSTKLGTASYNGTFFGCSKLVNAPELPATTLSMFCYYNLFYNTKINYVKMLGKTIVFQSLNYWMYGVPDVSTSVFVKHIDATWTTTGYNGVPTNWTVIYYDPALDKYYRDQQREIECDDHGIVKVIEATTNPELMAAVYAQGWSANQDYMTLEEAAAVTDIGTVFRNYNSITSLDELKFFTGITSIANLAFYYMQNLKTITIPENVRTIGINSAFGRLAQLERITWNTSYIHTPYPAIMYASEYEMTDWEFASDNPFYSIVGGCLYSADKTILYSVPIFKQVTFPQECVSIDKFGFFRNRITSAFVSPSLNYINNAERVFEMSKFTIIDLRDANIPIINQTFQSCGANTIILPSNCNDFRGNTFYNASNLTALVLYSTTPPTSVRAITYILNNTPITNGTGYVYVPDASVNAYKANSKWSAVESQIKPISEYNGSYSLT